jgi:hypothetical protein
MMKPIIDRKKFRDEIRKFSSHYIHYMLLDAIDILPQSKLRRLARGYIKLAQIESDGPPTTDRLIGGRKGI